MLAMESTGSVTNGSPRSTAPPLLGRRADHLGLAARQVAEHVDRVAANVHQRAARQGQVPADVLLRKERDAHPRLDALDLAQLAAADDLDEPLHERVVAVV